MHQPVSRGVRLRVAGVDSGQPGELLRIGSLIIEVHQTAVMVQLGSRESSAGPSLGSQPAWPISMRACSASHRNILVVDDEPLVCGTIAMLLEFDGHAVDRAESGEQALALFQPGKFDMVITDFSMPRMQGDELAGAIKLRSPAQPVVLLTAYAERFQAPNQPLSMIDCVLAKPPSIETLREAVTRFSVQQLAPNPSQD